MASTRVKRVRQGFLRLVDYRNIFKTELILAKAVNISEKVRNCFTFNRFHPV